MKVLDGVFLFNSVMLGVGLAMDAFSVSLANGMQESRMRRTRMTSIAGVYAGYQFLMPMVGWLMVHTLVEYFRSFQKFIPWIALALLLYIGGKMVLEGMKNQEEEESRASVLTFGVLMLQGIATSIDALSVGFAIEAYNSLMALVCCLIIAVVTFVICMAGLSLGKKFGTLLAGRASILGGIILIAIGIEIFVKGVF